MYWYGDHMSTWGYGLGILSMVLFWGLLIVAVIAAVRLLTRGSRQEHPNQQAGAAPPRTLNAEEMLAQRFASGEIDAGEYRERLAILREPRNPASVPEPLGYAICSTAVDPKISRLPTGGALHQAGGALVV